MEMQTRNFIISFAIRDYLHLGSGFNIRHEIPYSSREKGVMNLFSILLTYLIF